MNQTLAFTTHLSHILHPSLTQLSSTSQPTLTYLSPTIHPFPINLTPPSSSIPNSLGLNLILVLLGIFSFDKEELFWIWDYFCTYISPPSSQTFRHPYLILFTFSGGQQHEKFIEEALGRSSPGSARLLAELFGGFELGLEYRYSPTNMIFISINFYSLQLDHIRFAKSSF